MEFKQMIETTVNSIKSHEGFRASVYKDTLGYDTIGYGFAIKDLRINEQIGDLILREKLMGILNEIQENWSGWFYKMPRAVQGVLIEMIYQLGFDGVNRFKQTLKYLKHYEFKLASKEMLDSLWARQTPERAKELSYTIGKCNVDQY